MLRDAANFGMYANSPYRGRRLAALDHYSIEETNANAALAGLARVTRRLADVNLANLEAQDMGSMSPAHRVTHLHRLADASFLAAKDVDSMSRSQLDEHRRRLKYGRRVPRALAELMEEIEELRRYY